jgi:predicted RNase H-like nuclease
MSSKPFTFHFRGTVKKTYRSALRRCRRVQEFLTTNPVEGTAVKLQQLSEIIRELATNDEEQDATTRLLQGETARQRALRNALWERHMFKISRVARRAFGVPGMDQKFNLPRKSADNDAILAAARGMAQAAEQHAEVFAQQGFPADFVQRFRGAIDQLEGALTVRVEGQRRRKTSVETIDKLVKRGVAAIDVLDAIVRPELEEKPALLAAWKSVKRPKDPGGSSGLGAQPDITPVVKVA